jgi:hypothetical protein
MPDYGPGPGVRVRDNCGWAYTHTVQAVDWITVAITLWRFLSGYIIYKGNRDQHRACITSKSSRVQRESGRVVTTSPSRVTSD